MNIIVLRLLILFNCYGYFIIWLFIFIIFLNNLVIRGLFFVGGLKFLIIGMIKIE